MEKELLVSVKDMADAHRYGEDEHAIIKMFIEGCQALLTGAGAYKPDNPLTKAVMIIIVGHWLENRDNMSYDFKNVEKLPTSITAMVNVLRFVPDAVDATSMTVSDGTVTELVGGDKGA